MKKFLMLSILALVPILHANWFEDNSNKELTVRATAAVIGLYGLRTMVAFKTGARASNILRIPVGLTLVAAGFSGMIFAPEIVAECDNVHDAIMLEYYNDKFTHRRSEYTSADALKHAEYALKGAFRSNGK